MSINKTNNSDYEIILTETVDGTDWQSARNTAFNQLRSTLSAKGFRPGKAPLQYAKQRIAPERIYAEAAFPVAQRLLEQAIDEYDLVLLERPTLNYKDADEDSITIELTCIVAPQAGDFNYSEFEVEKENPELTDEEFDQVLNNALQPYANWVVVEREAQPNDQLLVDYKALDEDGPFAGMEGSEAEIIMYQRPQYESVYKALEGKKAGDVVNVEIPFGDHSANFEITIDEVQEKVLPEITEEFLTENNLGTTDVEEFLKNFRETVAANKAMAVSNQYLDQIVPAIIEQIDLEFPEVMIGERVNLMINRMINQMSQQGADVSQLIEIVQKDPESYIENLTPQAIEELKLDAALLKIAKDLGLESEQTENREARHMELRQKAVQHLVENAKIKSDEPAAEETNSEE